MMCLPDGTIETFSSVQAVAQSRAALAESLYVVEAIVTKHYEIDGDAFDAGNGVNTQQAYEPTFSTEIAHSNRFTSAGVCLFRNDRYLKRVP